jgi:hypothetical protein
MFANTAANMAEGIFTIAEMAPGRHQVSFTMIV